MEFIPICDLIQGMWSYCGHFHLHKQFLRPCGPNCGLSHVARNCKWSCMIHLKIVIPKTKSRVKMKKLPMWRFLVFFTVMCAFSIVFNIKIERWLYVVHTPWGSTTYSAHLSFHSTMILGRGCSFKQSLLFLSFLSQPLDEDSKRKRVQRLNALQCVFTCLIIVYP